MIRWIILWCTVMDACMKLVTADQEDNFKTKQVIWWRSWWFHPLNYNTFHSFHRQFVILLKSRHVVVTSYRVWTTSPLPSLPIFHRSLHRLLPPLHQQPLEINYPKLISTSNISHSSFFWSTYKRFTAFFVRITLVIHGSISETFRKFPVFFQ